MVQRCAVIGCNGDCARRTLRRKRTVGPEGVAARERWQEVLIAPADKQLAPMRTELVWALRGFGQRSTVGLWWPKQAGDQVRSHTKPGSLLKSRIPLRTWANLDEIAAIPL